MCSVISLKVLLILNMAPRGMITTTTVLLCFVLGLLNPAPAASRSHTSRSCCTKYFRKPVPINRITGYMEQHREENCRIEAIIFYTVMKKEICATREDEWVRKILASLSTRLKKMSKDGKDEKENAIKKNRKEAFLTTTESFLNTTYSFY
ncbi:C-C motif chemokine 20-like [Sphaeramia orbicularis]|uniref:C-C motif chemokine 20-like n=1 Tax=Sphaeramia orbicularis TaxID=375764 RepID=A0A673AEP0_9TELE|nr:C-C motif chemokine 20-like [Sphaeramia orbicularis]